MSLKAPPSAACRTTTAARGPCFAATDRRTPSSKQRVVLYPAETVVLNEGEDRRADHLLLLLEGELQVDTPLVETGERLAERVRALGEQVQIYAQLATPRGD